MLIGREMRNRMAKRRNLSISYENSQPFDQNRVLDRTNQSIAMMMPKKDVIQFTQSLNQTHTRNFSQLNNSKQPNADLRNASISTAYTKEGKKWEQMAQKRFSHTTQLDYFPHRRRRNLSYHLEQLMAVKPHEEDLVQAIHDVESKFEVMDNVEKMMRTMEKQQDKENEGEYKKHEYHSEILRSPGEYKGKQTPPQQLNWETKTTKFYQSQPPSQQPRALSRIQMNQIFIKKQKLIQYKKQFYNNRSVTEEPQVYKQKPKTYFTSVAQKLEQQRQQQQEFQRQQAQKNPYQNNAYDVPQIIVPENQNIPNNRTVLFNLEMRNIGERPRKLSDLKSQYQEDSNRYPNYQTLENLNQPSNGQRQTSQIQTLLQPSPLLNQQKQLDVSNKNFLHFQEEVMSETESQMIGNEIQPLMLQPIRNIINQREQPETAYGDRLNLQASHNSDLTNVDLAHNNMIVRVENTTYKKRLGVGPETKQSLPEENNFNNASSLQQKEFNFEPQQYHNRVYVEKIPKFLLRGGKTSIQKLLNDMKLSKDVTSAIKIRNDN